MTVFAVNMGLNWRVLTVLISILVCSLSSISYCDAIEADINCLIALKASLEDPLKILNTTWNFDNRTEGSICNFAGIECWHPGESKVVNIRLGDMGLKGEFPRGLADCTALVGLNLSRNELHGNIPPDISHILPFVTSLDLSSNSFSGEIPADLANCSYLNVLRLDNNRLTGQIPPELGLLGRIKTFSVANNLLTGPVPRFNETRGITAESYANNMGLCGAPLRDCGPPRKKTHGGVIAGAAAGGVVLAAIGVGMFFFLRRVSRKKEENDAEGKK